MKDYQETTGRSVVRGTKKLLGVMRATEILLYTPMLKWHLSHRLTVTAIHKYIKYVSAKPISWFPEEVNSSRQKGNNDTALKKLGDTKKLEGNSFYER